MRKGEKKEMNKRIIRFVMMVFMFTVPFLYGFHTEAAEPHPVFVLPDGDHMLVGASQKITVSGADNIEKGEWSVSDDSALSLSGQSKDSVMVKALKYASDVTVTYTYSYKEEISDPEIPVDSENTDDLQENDEEPVIKTGMISVTISVSDPKLSKSSTFLSLNKDSEKYDVITLAGLQEDSSVQVMGDDVYHFTGPVRKNAVSGEYEMEIMVGAKSVGQKTLTISADGKNMTFQAVVLSLSFNRTTKTVGDCYSDVYVNKKKAVFREDMSMLALYSGSSTTIKLSGAGNYPVNWKSSNSSVASVSGSGTKAVVRGKSKCGYATITATVAGGPTLTYKVGVAKKAAIQTLLRGEKQAGAIYSQAKRMYTGYYDCSSFVWRMYKQAGIKFGVSSGWAPTAAMEAYYATTHYKILSWSNYDESKMLPGDILFYSSGKNGRFMNITHVAMYIKPGTRIDAHVVPTYNVGERTSTSTDVVMAVRPTSGTTKKVSSLKASTVKKTSVKLTWSPANSVTGYKVYKYDSSKKKYVLYKRLSYKKDACTISGLKAGATYKFKVCAYKGTRNYTASKISVKTTQ